MIDARRVASVVGTKCAISSKTRYSREIARQGGTAAAAEDEEDEEAERRREEDKNIAGDGEDGDGDERGVVVHVAGEAVPPEGKKAV